MSDVISSSAYCGSAKKIKTKRMNLKGPDDVRCLRARWIASVPNADPARGLLAFTLKPEGMKGEELLAHLCKLRNRAATVQTQTIHNQ
jgi:hypothetical protein